MKLRIEDCKMNVSSCTVDNEVDLHLVGTCSDYDYKYIAEMDYNKEEVQIVSSNALKTLQEENHRLRLSRARINYFPIQDRTCNIPYWIEPTKVIFNGPATIVFWNDNTKTVVKCQCDHTQNRDHEKCKDSCPLFDKEMGFAMACAKKLFGNKGSYYNKFKEVLKGEQ